ncbi:hypothetical protein [Variovorax sp. dw_308]|uniref:hypothetical protein n=1 Tax=Variovorax sp. dw_308 TaxID=2721546 RepID=UPI001C471052|nr:hypothetical protein [Variovorax sp. dw_308]
MKNPDSLLAARLALAMLEKLPVRNDGGHVVLVTSAVAGEGKSFVSRMLAHESAQSTLGDIGLVSTGFIDATMGTRLVDTSVHATQTPHLFYIPVSQEQRRDELYNAAAVAAGIVALRTRFRLSLIDGPVIANCGALLARVDAVLLVVDSVRTSPQKVRRALREAAIAPTDITGVVLNRAPQPLPSWIGGD